MKQKGYVKPPNAAPEWQAASLEIEQRSYGVLSTRGACAAVNGMMRNYQKHTSLDIWTLVASRLLASSGIVSF